MKYLLEKIIQNEFLSELEAADFIYKINEDKFNASTVSGIMVAIQMRGIQLSELKGFRKALLELCLPLELDKTNAIDLCGTGGDGKDTFNISTCTALFLAAMDYKVIKHGNYGVSSFCGSSDVLKELGFDFHTDSKKLQSDLKQNNICFLHAPLFHPALNKVAVIRKELGVKTLFNSLGPLVNPVQPTHQLTGTYSLELAKMYQHILAPERAAFQVIHGMEGYDEITLIDDTRMLGKNTDSLLNSFSFLEERNQIADLKSGSSIKEAAQIIINLLKGNGSEGQNKVIAANLAVAMQLFHEKESHTVLYDEAKAFVQSGMANKKFKLN